MAGHVSHIEGGEVLEEYLGYDLSGKERGLVSRTAARKWACANEKNIQWYMTECGKNVSATVS